MAGAEGTGRLPGMEMFCVLVEVVATWLYIQGW